MRFDESSSSFSLETAPRRGSLTPGTSMRQGLTTSYPLTRGVLTHQLYGPTPGKWALCSSTSGRRRRACPVRRRHYPPRGRTPTRRPPTASLMCSIVICATRLPSPSRKVGTTSPMPTPTSPASSAIPSRRTLIAASPPSFAIANGLVELQVAVESSVGRVTNVAGEEDVLEDYSHSRKG